ncbi:MAG TPA: hypothetical protein PKW56_07090 [Clostridiales bacterium]|nr:hypothetical protein [Clostridiales bacterium]
MFKKMIKVLGLSLLAVSVFTACTDDSDPVIPEDDPVNDLPYARIGSFANAGESVLDTINVTSDEQIYIYWIEDGVKSDADISCTVYRKDGTTVYLQEDNDDKPFENINNSTPVKPKSVIALDDEIIVKIDAVTAGAYSLLATDSKLFYYAKEGEFAAATDSLVYTVSVDSGKTVWIYETESSPMVLRASVTKADGSFYVMNNGKTFDYKKFDKAVLEEDQRRIVTEENEIHIKIKYDSEQSTGDLGSFKFFVQDVSTDE